MVRWGDSSREYRLPTTFDSFYVELIYYKLSICHQLAQVKGNLDYYCCSFWGFLRVWIYRLKNSLTYNQKMSQKSVQQTQQFSEHLTHLINEFNQSYEKEQESFCSDFGASLTKIQKVMEKTETVRYFIWRCSSMRRRSVRRRTWFWTTSRRRGRRYSKWSSYLNCSPTADLYKSKQSKFFLFLQFS